MAHGGRRRRAARKLLIVATEKRPVPSIVRSSDLKPENKVLVVLTTILQLSAIILVWLLAIVPAALLALAAILGKTVARVLRGARKPSPTS